MSDGRGSFQTIKLPQSAHYFVMLWCWVQRATKLSAVVFRNIAGNKLRAESEANPALALCFFIYFFFQTDISEQEISTAADSQQKGFQGLLEGKHSQAAQGPTHRHKQTLSVLWRRDVEDGWSGQDDMTAEWLGKITARHTSLSSTGRLMSEGGTEGSVRGRGKRGEDEAERRWGWNISFINDCFQTERREGCFRTTVKPRIWASKVQLACGGLSEGNKF